MAVSIGHRGNDPVIAMSLGAKGHVRNPSHHFTNAELAHPFSPSLTICGTPPSHRCSSLRGDCDEKKKQTRLFHDHQNQGLEMPVTLLALRRRTSAMSAAENEADD
jgi:hypothetical protein